MKACICIAVREGFEFAAATTIMSIMDNSPIAYKESDIIVIHSISDQKMLNLLHDICGKIIFISAKKGVGHPCVDKILGIQFYTLDYYKLPCMELVKKYDKVFYIENGSLVLKEICEIYKYECDIAYLPHSTINPPMAEDLFYFNKREKRANIPHCFGVCILFSKSILNKTNLAMNILNEANNKAKILKRNDLEDSMITYIAYSCELQVLKLESKYFSIFQIYNEEDTKIVFFTKEDITPWNNDLVYAIFPEFGIYYNKWQRSGGTGPIIDYNGKNLFNPAERFNFFCWHAMFDEVINDIFIDNHNVIIDYEIQEGTKLRLNIRDVKDNFYIEIMRHYYKKSYTIYFILADLGGLVHYLLPKISAYYQKSLSIKCEVYIFQHNSIAIKITDQPNINKSFIYFMITRFICIIKKLYNI